MPATKTDIARTFWLYGLGVPICVVSILAILKYPGQPWVYAAFTVTANLLLYFGFRRNAIFFDTFIAIFFWLGFWFKLSIRVAFLDGRFVEPVGNFDGSGNAFDRALLVASCAFLGVLAASVIREKYLFTYPSSIPRAYSEELLDFYRRHRKLVLLAYAALISFVAATNFHFGIYQRGTVPRSVLPLGLGGLYSWLLLFGLASLSAVLLHLEFALRKAATYPVVLLSLLEGLLSNVSMLSRGMILNTGALAYGLFRGLKLSGIKTSLRFWAISFLLLCAVFGASVVVVSNVRSAVFVTAPQVNPQPISQKTREAIASLILDRWVGIEGVMAVSSCPCLGWQLWRQAWREIPVPAALSFYDKTLITSPYANTDMTEYRYVSLPGIVAFFFYPGSFAFLFACLFVLGLIAAGIEMSVFALGGRNVVLCALLAEVVASRYAHFGYSPSQSYLLFGALYCNLLLIYFFDRSLYWAKSQR